MKFYESLTRPVAVGAITVGPMLSQRNGRWEIAAGLEADRLIEPFISEHMNEALNPSRYAFNREEDPQGRARSMSGMAQATPRTDAQDSPGKDFGTPNLAWRRLGQWLPSEETITLAGECF